MPIVTTALKIQSVQLGNKFLAVPEKIESLDASSVEFFPVFVTTNCQ